MTTRIVQTIEAALADVIAENNLERIDVGFSAYSASVKPYIVTIWFNAPVGVDGCSHGRSTTIDEALAEALAKKSRTLSPKLVAAE